jgi:hypothetical protein
VVVEDFGPLTCTTLGPLAGLFGADFSGDCIASDDRLWPASTSIESSATSWFAVPPAGVGEEGADMWEVGAGRPGSQGWGFIVMHGPCPLSGLWSCWGGGRFQAVDAVVVSTRAIGCSRRIGGKEKGPPGGPAVLRVAGRCSRSVFRPLILGEEYTAAEDFRGCY